MGQHKSNPTAIAAKEGTLPERRSSSKMSKRDRDRLLMSIIREKSALDALERELDLYAHHKRYY